MNRSMRRHHRWRLKMKPLRKGKVRFAVQERKTDLRYIETHKKDKRISFDETFS